MKEHACSVIYLTSDIRRKHKSFGGICNLRPADRRAEILRLGQLCESLVVDDIANRLSVSKETVRRDLARLDADGLLRRVHGGAVPPRVTTEAPFIDRQKLNAQGKQRIAVLAASLIETGESLMIDTGSTTEAFAAALPNLEKLTVITNSARVAAPIAASGRNTVFVLGGAYQVDGAQMLGALCLEQLNCLRADHAILGVGAICADGWVMDYDMDEALLAKAMMARVRRTTILADYSKFDRRALSVVCAITELSRIITDRDPPAAIEQAIRQAGIELLVAAPT